MIVVQLDEKGLRELLATGLYERKTGPKALYPWHDIVKLNARAAEYAKTLKAPD